MSKLSLTSKHIFSYEAMVSLSPLISVIIPTYKEESWLPKLLQCLHDQTFKDFEVVVADNNSPDNTRKVARDFGARVTDGGLPGRGRNIGAKYARGKILYFIDADVLLPKNFLEKTHKQFLKKKCDVGTTYTRANSEHPFDIFFFSLCNLGVFLFRFFSPIAHGFNIIVTKKRFDEVGGFDESLVAGEDFDFVKRASSGHKFSVFTGTYDIASVRRFQKIGRLKMFFHLILLIVRTMIFRQKLHRVGDYDWTGYGKKVKGGKKVTLGEE